MDREKKLLNYCAVVLIAVVGLIIYANSLGGSFVWDDTVLIKDNVALRSPNRSLDFIGQSWRGGTISRAYPARPVQIITYVAEYSLWKLNVFGYHLVSVIFHILAAICVWQLVNLLFRNNLLALLTSLFFMVHPVHTEAVSYISGLADPMSAVFILSCLIFYIKGVEDKNIYFNMAAAVLCVLALLTRENSVMLPVLILLYHYISKERVRIKDIAPVFIITGIYIALKVTALKPICPILCNTTPLQRLPGFFVAITNYLRLLVLPFGLHMEYGTKFFTFGYPQAVIGLSISAALVALAFIYRRKSPLIFFSISWFLIMLLPQSNLIPVNAYMAEHWLYLPSIGFALLISEGILYIYKYKLWRAAALGIAAALLIFYAFLTIRQNDYWKEPINFYERTVKYAPWSKGAYTNLAALYNDAGRQADAIRIYERVLEIDSNYPIACSNLAKIYGEMGRRDEATALFERAIARDRNCVLAYNNLANIYSDMGKRDEAVALYKKAIEINPGFALAYNNLANRYGEMGRYDEAIALYNKALEIDPGFAAVYNNMAKVYNDMGKLDEAILLLEKALAIDPTLTAARDNLNKLRAIKERGR